MEVPPLTRLKNTFENSSKQLTELCPTAREVNAIKEDLNDNMESALRLLQDWTFKNIYKRSQYGISQFVKLSDKIKRRCSTQSS